MKRVYHRLGQYEQHDLVQLVDVVGVIVECGADTAKILTSGGRPDRPEIRTVRLPDIKKRAGSRNAVTNDLGLQPVHQSTFRQLHSTPTCIACQWLRRIGDVLTVAYGLGSCCFDASTWLM